MDLSRHLVDFTNRRLDARAAGRRRSAPRVRAVAGNIVDLETLRFPAGLGPPFHFAFNPHNSIRHLTSPRDLAGHLRSMARVLVRGGVYAVGVELLARGERIAGEDVHTARRGGVRVSAVFEYFESPRSATAPRLERVVSFTTVRVGRRVRTMESAYDLLCIDPALWRRAVAAAGFEEVAVVDDERARDLPPGRGSYAYRVLRRRGG